MEKVKIEGLYDAANRAYRNVSFDPEKRAEQVVKLYEEELNEDLESINESEHERYIEGYKKHLFAWLSAKSRTMSVMITGPARFPVERNQKAMNAEHARSVEFTEWRKRALSSIKKRQEASKTDAEKQIEAIEDWKQQVDRLFEGFLVDRFRSRLETVARTGNVELVNAVLEYFDAKQTEKGVVLATPRHGVWKVSELAEKYRASLENTKTANSEESEINGVKVVRNQQADRLQLFFPGKPDQETISKLKHAAFKWSPSNGCWQRQLTQNAIWAAERLLSCESSK